jgi:hypothetical protein
VRLRAERIAFGRVVSSPWCRCLDTAALVDVGPVQVEPAFANAFVLRDRREALREAAGPSSRPWRGPGVLLVVTHGENIQALTGRTPATAELVVVAPGATARCARSASWRRRAAETRARMRPHDLGVRAAVAPRRHRMKRRTILQAPALLCVPALARAQSFPTKPIRYIVRSRPAAATT